MLSEARKLDQSIQSINDLDDFLVQHPKHDIAINEFYIESGYLQIWSIEHDRNPWYYNLDAMEEIASHHMESVKQYCKLTITDEPRDQNRFTQNLDGYIDLNMRYPRETFDTLISLYTILAQLHRRRFDIAQEWLQNTINHKCI